jgi:hypothetical protein
MKTEISRDSHQPQKHYSGVYQQQGRMLTDADWNEQVEILKERLNDALKDVVGNKAGSMGGTPRHRALKILKIVKDGVTTLKIQPGHVYIDGLAAQVSGDEDMTYDHQPDFPSPPDLPQASGLTDKYIIYADVWERPVIALEDDQLLDPGLHGADTCTRTQTMTQIKWCLEDKDPERPEDNPQKGNALVTVSLHKKLDEKDPCDPCANVIAPETRIGNYLFRVEVHNVKELADGPSDVAKKKQVTLKWSSENGAEQYAVDAVPDDFKKGDWIWEIYDLTSEKHLGVHLVDDFIPHRYDLVTSFPESPAKGKFVRRWDGYVVLNRKTDGTYVPATDADGKIIGKDKNAQLSESTDPADKSHGAVLPCEAFKVNLKSLTLTAELKGKTVITGDYWLAVVREAEHKAGSVLIENKTPYGIKHHYLTLGTIVGGMVGSTLQANPEADRKYAFPPLTEMTRIFIAGGDGQEVIPGQPLPQPLRVGVANGEWPVEGATVRFQMEYEGGGSLSPVNSGKTNADGIAECEWTPGTAMKTDFRVKATLIDPDHANDASMDIDPPVYFYANLVSADQVAYGPKCRVSGENAVHSHLVNDSELDLGEDNYYTVKEVLDALLCKLRAKHIPYNPRNEEQRWSDILDQSDLTTDFPSTVQAAIDMLISKLESSDIAYQLPSCSDAIDSIRKRLFPNDSSSSVRDVLNTLLCILDASTIPYDRNTNDGSLRDGFVDKSGDTMTGQLKIDDGSSDHIHNLLDVKGSIVIGENNHRNGKIRLWQESNNDDDSVSHAIGTEVFHNTYGAGSKYPNSIGHRFYRGGGELIAQIGFGGGGRPEKRLNSFFQGKIGIGTAEKLSMLTVMGKGWELKTGTIQVTAHSRDVIGTGTKFLSEVGIGDVILYSPLDNNNVDAWIFRFTIPRSFIVTELISDTELKASAEFIETISGRWTSLNSRFRVENQLGNNPFIISPGGTVGINTMFPSYLLHTNGKSYAIERAGGGIDYAEYFESLNEKEIPLGTAVVFEKGKVRKAKKGEIPIGVISANPIIVGGVHAEWPKKYLRDEFGKLIIEEYKEEIMAPKKEIIKKERQKMEKKKIKEVVTRTEIVFKKKKYRQKEITETVTREIEEPVFEEVDLYDAAGKNVIGKHKIPVMETYEEEIEVLDGDGQPVLVGTLEFVTRERPKVNPDYDESREYLPREQRPEWNCVGLLGQLHLRKGQPVAPTWIKIKDISDEVELWLVK